MPEPRNIMSSWRWQLHPGWGGTQHTPAELPTRKLRWSTVVIASTQLTWQCHLSYILSEVWVVEATQWYRGKAAKITNKTIDVCGWFVSSHHLWFWKIYSPEFGCISFRTSGLCETNESLNYDHLPKCIRSCFTNLQIREIFRPRCNNKGGITQLGPQNPSKIHQHSA